MSHTAFSEHLDPLVHAEAIRAQMDLILSSPSFRNSKRHTRFLQYIVEKTVSGHSGVIKERSIGIEVFDRAPDYDLANDAIVRVAAAEMRKRLAQYYVNEAHGSELRIELLSGSYVPIFMPCGLADATIATRASAASRPSTPPPMPIVAKEFASPYTQQSFVKRKTGLRLRIWSGALCVAALVAAMLLYQNRRGRQLEEFWAPMLAGDQVVVCIGDLNSIMPDNSDISTEPVSQLQSRRNHVGPYDVGALARLAGFLGEQRKQTTVYLADNANLTDFRTQPAIFIGAFDNQWTQRVMADFRFRLQSDSVHERQIVVDSQSPEHLSWSIGLGQPLSAISRDYAIVARVNSSLTGQPDMIVAGLGPYGTTAASEFVSKPEYFREFTSKAPRGWEHKDIEIILSTDVVNGRSSPPQMIAFDVR